MKKIIYTILFAALLLIPFSSVNAAQLSMEEAYKYGEVSVNKKVEIDNIYIAGNVLTTGLIKATDVPSGVQTGEIIKYNTEKGIWVYLDGTPATITLKSVKQANGVAIQEDEISSYDELIKSIGETDGGATTLIIKNDITGLSEPIVVNRELTIDGEGNTLNFTKQLMGDAILLVNSEKITLSNLNINVDSRRSEHSFFRTAIRLENSKEITMEEISLAFDYGHTLVVSESELTISGTVEFMTADDLPGVQIRDEVPTTNSTLTIEQGGQLVMENEAPLHGTVEKMEDAAVITPGNALTKDSKIDSIYYVDSANSKYTMLSSIGYHEVPPMDPTATTSSYNIQINANETSELTSGSNIKLVASNIVTPAGATFKLYDGSTNVLENTDLVLYEGTYGSFSSGFDGKIVADIVGDYSITFTLYDASLNKALDSLTYDFIVETPSTEPPAPFVESSNVSHINKDTMSYKPSSDDSIVAGKDYYTCVTNATNGHMTCTIVANPVLSELTAGNYYEVNNQGWISLNSTQAFEGKLSIAVTEKPSENATVTIYYGGEVLTEDTKVDVSVDSASIYTDIIIEADTEGYYEVDVNLENTQGEIVSTTEIDFEYEDSSATN